MLGQTLMSAVAVKVTLVSGAFLEACNANDDHYLRIAHELRSSPGMPETVVMWGSHWLVLMHSPAETR